MARPARVEVSPWTTRLASTKHRATAIEMIRTGEHQCALGVLDTATAISRGVPFDEFAVDEFAAPEAVRLAELGWHAGSSPMVLMIDDLHWADIETIEVLGHLMDGEWPGGLTIVVAARSDTGPWQRLVAEAIEHQHCMSVPLAGLRREGVAELARTRFGVAKSDRIAFDVHRQTGGNPLLVGAVLDDLASHEALLAAGVPSRVSLLAAGRMAQLNQAATLVLHAASAAGTSVSTLLLATVLALDEQAVARSIAAVHAQHLVTINIEKATSVRFSHDLYRQAVYESMSFDRREELHTRFAAYFDERRSSAGVAADHWQRAESPFYVGDLVNATLWVTYCDGASAVVGSLVAGVAVGAGWP